MDTSPPPVYLYCSASLPLRAHNWLPPMFLANLGNGPNCGGLGF